MKKKGKSDEKFNRCQYCNMAAKENKNKNKKKVIAILGCIPTSLGEGGTGSDHTGGPRLLLRGALIMWRTSGRKAKMLKKVCVYLQDRRPREGHECCLQYLKNHYAEKVLVLHCVVQRAELEQKGGSDKETNFPFECEHSASESCPRMQERFAPGVIRKRKNSAYWRCLHSTAG